MKTTAKTVVVKKGERIFCDGKVIDGFALVDESAMAGVSTPAMIDTSNGRNQVIAGTVIVDGWLKIECHCSKNSH